MQKVGYAWLKQHTPERLINIRAEAIQECIRALETNWVHKDPIMCLRALLDGEPK